MSTVEVIPAAAEEEVNDNEDAVQEDEVPTEEHEATIQQKEIIRYSLSTLLSLRSSKLSQTKPACRNLDLSCMAHHKPPPKTLIANMMPKFALNQMQNRGEESISPLSFHSNSSSSSNLSYQKRYQDSGRDGRDAREGPIRRDDGRDGRDDGGYSNSRYYYNKYNKYDNNSGSSRIIYKTTGANASNGNNIRLLNKAFNSKYESQESSVGMISNKNILENSSRVITAADHRNSKKILDLNDAEEKKIKEAEEAAKKSPSDDTNNNENAKKETQEGTNVGEVNANELQVRNSGQNDLKNLPDDITNHLDDMFNNMNMGQLLPEKSEERGSSRFSKWFNVSKDDTKDEKVPDLQNNNNDGNNVAFPQSVESEKYFQPIDKVESNSLFQMLKGQPERPKEDNPLMHMIQNQQKQQQQKSPNSGQVHSVEELEARLRQHKMNDEQNERKSIESEQRNAQEIMKLHMMQQQQQHQPMAQNQEDVNAFRKLLSQIAVEETKVPAQMNPNGPNILQQMMNKSFPQQGAEAMLQQQQKGFPMGGKMPAKMMNPNPVAAHMMPQQQQQFDMMKFMQQQQQKMPIPQMPEVIKRPEVQAIVQELSAGELSQFNLYQRLTAPGLSPIERDIITSALNIFSATSNANGNSAMFQKSMQPIGGNNLFPMKTNALSAPIPMPQGSPLSPVPPQLDQHLLFQHQAAAAAAASKLRLSPLPAAGMPQRIPSPRELQYHTQSIMQNALIRKKLEEQRENFRKRQEQEQKEQMQQKQESDRKNQQDPSLEGCVTSPSQSPEEVPKGILDSPIKKAPAQHQLQRQHAPSPNIFTPTSVLRKMTAEKDGDGKMGSEKKKAITGAQQPRMQQQQQQQQQQFMGNLAQLDRIMQMQQAQSDPFGKVNWDAQPAMKSQGEMRPSEFSFEAQSHMPHPAGRPIVKSAGPGTSQTQQSNPMMTAAQQQPNMMPGNFDFQQQQMQKINLQKQYLQQQQLMQMKKQQQMENPALSQFMAQQQQRAQQQQQHMIRQQQFPQQMNYAQQMMQGRQKEPEEMDNRNVPDNGRNNGGCLSPTSNQLAKWFSPELLADASAGKLPSMKMNGQMLSLEEFEKCIQNS